MRLILYVWEIKFEYLGEPRWSDVGNEWGL